MTSLWVGVDWLVAGWQEVEELGAGVEAVPELRSSAAAVMVVTLKWDDFVRQGREGQE